LATITKLEDRRSRDSIGALKWKGSMSLGNESSSPPSSFALENESDEMQRRRNEKTGRKNLKKKRNEALGVKLVRLKAD